MAKLTKRAKWTLIGVAIAIVAVVFVTAYPGRPELAPAGDDAERVTERWLDVVHERAEDGYWLVVRGTHPGDQVVAAATAGTLTHAAVFDRERDEVIEASGEGVHRTPVHDLVAEAFRLLIIRPRDYTEEEGHAAVRRARTRVGAAYDWLGTVGAQTDERFYCTELALDAYRARDRGWHLPPVVHPRQMATFGRVVFDSGARERQIAIHMQR